MTGLVFVSSTVLPLICLTVSTGTHDFLEHGPAVDKPSPPVKWKRFAPLGIQNSIPPSAPAVVAVLRATRYPDPAGYAPEGIAS